MKGAVSDHDFRMMRTSLNKAPGARGTELERYELSVKRYTLPYLNLNRSMICLKKKGLRVQSSEFSKNRKEERGKACGRWRTGNFVPLRLEAMEKTRDDG
jgi:hypothetical protein